VADYAAELLPALAERAKVTLLQPPGEDPFAPELDGFARLPWDAPARAGTASLLHLGNNPYHLWVARRLRRHGGIVVLHDTVLHHLLVEEAVADDAWERFASELSAAHGSQGRALAVARRWGYHGRTDPFLLPARSVYLQHARGVIVHSVAAAEQVREACPAMAVRTTPLAVAALATGQRRRWRTKLGAGDSTLLLAHLGFLTPAKGLPVILGALCALRKLKLDCRLVVVGEGSERDTVLDLARQAGLADRIVVYGYAPRRELGGILGAADLGLVPRFPTAGETSAAALRFLAVGTPVAVTGLGQFLELAPEAAFRLAPGRAGVADLVRAVAYLAGSPAARQQARRAAKEAWHNGGHDPAHAAEALVHVVAELGADVV
jgi:glycosyltransferase involved in cell wall biosynthesis